MRSDRIMIPYLLRLASFITTFLALGHLNGQWGIRATVLHIERSTQEPQPNFLIGLDVDLSDRSGIGLDFNYGVNLDLLDVDLGNSGSYSGSGPKDSKNVWGLTYRSQYFFTDNDRFAGYIGPFIGIRKADFVAY